MLLIDDRLAVESAWLVRVETRIITFYSTAAARPSCNTRHTVSLSSSSL